MINTVLEHVPIKLEVLDNADQFGDCTEWKASTETTPTAAVAAAAATANVLETDGEEKPTPKIAATTSSASSTSSRTANLDDEIESCGNVFILNRRKLFLICGFCDSKYANMLQFAKHVNDSHTVFSVSCDESNYGRGSAGASEAESDSDASAVTGLIVKGGFQIRFVREGSMMGETMIPTPPPSVDDTLLKHVPIKVEDDADDDVTMVDDNSTAISNFENNIESCGNVFVLNRRKLILICGFCEGKYATMGLFATHLHESHTIFQEDNEHEPHCQAQTQPTTAPAEVVVKQEPTEVPVIVKCHDINNENAPPMVAIPKGTNVDNEDIIPQEEIISIAAAAAAEASAKEKSPEDSKIISPQQEIMTLAVAAAAAAAAKEKKILKETQRKSPKTNSSKTIKDYFCKEESPVSIFRCKECPKTFNKQSRLTEHIRLHTGEKPFKCEECGKSFRIKLRMTEHQLRHRSEKAFICEICGLGLATRQDYSLHQRHHNGDKRYACQECGKAFVRSSDLKTHLRIHSDERPFKCEICNISFRANQNLIIHRRVHQGDKQFKCDFCDKRFLRKIDKRVHHRTHTGEKAFKCEICGRGYSAKVHVRRHIQKRHMDPMKSRETSEETTSSAVKSKKHNKPAKKPNKSFKCNACPKSYSAKVTLQKHVKQCHGASSTDEDKTIPGDQPSSSPPPLVSVPKSEMAAI